MLTGFPSPFPTLTTARLYLRQIVPADAQSLFAIKSDPQVTFEYGQEPHPSVADTLGWIERLQAGYDQHDSIAWGVALKDAAPGAGIIGAVVLWNFDPSRHTAELGYELHPGYQRKGITSEAAAAVLAFAFAELGLHRIEACPLADNESSRKFLLKLGFTYEGNLRQRVFFHGKHIDQLYFGMLKEEFRG